MKLTELLETVDHNALRELNHATTALRGPEVISTIKQLIADGKVTDEVVYILLKNTSSSNAVVQKLSMAGYKFPKEIQQLAIDKSVFNIQWINDPDPDVLKQALSSHEFVTSWPATYKDVVKKHFAHNSLLMNKWLRYAKNILGE